MIDDRDLAVSQAHDTISFLGEDLACLSGLTPEHNWEAPIKELQVILYEPASTAALLSCNITFTASAGEPLSDICTDLIRIDLNLG